MTVSSFRLLTFNCLWRGAARERLEAIAGLLDETGIDFLCLQEVTRRRSVPLLEAHLASYRPAAFLPFGIAVTGGLVSFARHPIERTSYEVFNGRGPHWTMGWVDRLFRKGFLATWLRIGALWVVVVNTHLLANYDEDWTPNNRFAREQRDDLEQLAAAIGRLDPEALLIVAGDFNVPVTSPMLEEFTSNCGLRNVFASVPQGSPPTFRQPAQAIDHILYRHPSGRPLRVAARLRFEEPVRLANDRLAFASDHLAVEAEFILDPDGAFGFED